MTQRAGQDGGSWWGNRGKKNKLTHDRFKAVGVEAGVGLSKG
jgi:hypothetical protein